MPQGSHPDSEHRSNPHFDDVQVSRTIIEDPHTSVMTNHGTACLEITQFPSFLVQAMLPEGFPFHQFNFYHRACLLLLLKVKLVSRHGSSIYKLSIWCTFFQNNALQQWFKKEEYISRRTREIILP